MNKGIDGSKEMLFTQVLEGRTLCQKPFTDTDELLNTTFLTQECHLIIKVLIRVATLQNITQNQCAPATLVVRTTVHEVKCNIQRIEVRVVGVVNERTSVLSFLHLQAHSYWLQLCHPLAENSRGNAQVE